MRSHILDFFWTNQSLSESESSALPPPEVLEEVLNNVYISLHPQTQYKATYSTPSGPPMEPTLALYCPIEGGNYVIDDTVRELARKTGSDVVVLDAVHMAAGEWGHFGQAASLIELPQNPLHFSIQTTPSFTRSAAARDDDDDDDEFGPASPAHMTFQVVVPQRAPRMSGNGPSNGSVAKAKSFFDTCINVQTRNDAGTPDVTSRPRLIYIRDFGTLSSSWPSLHPALLSAVRQRRQGALARTSSPVANPTVIVFGITPSIFPQSSTPPTAPGPQSLMNLLTNRSGQATPGAATSKPGKSDWGEEDHSEKVRERRLRERLRKWERGDHALQSEFPKLLTGPPVEDEPSSPGLSDVVVVGGPGGGGNPINSFFGPFFGGRRPRLHLANPNTPISSGFLRVSILVPTSRSLSHEKASRMGRRREINELTMRMAIGTVGGQLEPRGAASVFSAYPESVASSEHARPGGSVNGAKMWDDWGNKIETWTAVKQIGDQSVGRAISSSSPETVRSSLSSISVPWVHVCGAWADHRASLDFRKAWIQQSSNRLSGEDQQDRDRDNERERHVDNIIEAVKHDPYLDSHEQRLLGCIVDSVSMPTTFSHVHLPAHTIDSVRTIVSLPLLHPTAFQQGILKEHSMTGCLLFGPPGTGKTLVVRALAKEAGCRMLAISPSDVMDMYVGEGEKLVRSVFSLARRLAPCVVFIDEIDALFGARSSSRDTAGGFVHRGVITEFMQEMDGLKTSNTDNVIVIGATNRPFDLDDAVLRRLPRRLLVDLPGEREREEILKILLREEVLSPEVDLKALARDTPTFSGSDLKHVCVSAALDAVKENVSVPWVVEPPQDTLRTSHADGDGAVTQSLDDSTVLATQKRVLRPRNFAKALKEITPSASESLGTLADLRRWNDEFGEGRKRKKQVWGKDRFGFTRRWDRGEDGKVATACGCAPLVATRCRSLRRFGLSAVRNGRVVVVAIAARVASFILVLAFRRRGSSRPAWPIVLGRGRLADGHDRVAPDSPPVLAADRALAVGPAVRVVARVVHAHSAVGPGARVAARKDLNRYFNAVRRRGCGAYDEV
ncbi:hypothetical protein F5148DRAFT_1298209 [Russula earlei]|uniref:Uncharacterized protein n=1 Tax=Russula earlei TaxID=71964 RepID=A0ACC0UH07_9AGAM|nr:hypothetical protein F5148DRAFT_1298209 [Russula earlei]